MKISILAIDRRTTVFVVLALIFMMGVYSYVVLPRESAPEVVVPYITVATTYQGVAPADMESLVSVPIERKLTGLSGVKEITSTSLEGLSTIVIEFEADEDIDEALQRVRDRVDLAKPDIPEDADDPLVQEIDISEFPIMVMSLSGDVPPAQLTDIAEDIEDAIETIKGVLDVAVIGGVEREIQIEVDPSRVAAYGVPFADLIQIARLENANTPGGALDLGEAKYLVRTPGEFKTPDELNGLIVKRGQTGNVYLRDVATVSDTYKELDSVSRLDGRPSVTLTVSKRSGENIIEIATQVKAVLDSFRANLPPNINIALTWDESTWVRDMVSELENNILSGLILVLAVVFLFLGFTNAFFVALAIPVSMLITFSILNLGGTTLNMVVLFSLTLSLGMLVDNGIVVVENIYRHGHMEKSRVRAAKDGTAEVAWPVCAST
ncbi:MAG TPA: efflux RND transporter permease subunit, partial [Candidatus Hydrogenedentes bacterium]|nr:efflux RND transporter permease subunit [Candidatus Hydrogenedentota bacterium]